ncbi:MAG: HAMP domain-containing histidine kinase, partial [Gemmatimonadetes bacterium]|nr:HAMP domain-containing histidine kinase [Gemmatimonadota bacterium]
VLRCWTALEEAPAGERMVATLRAFDAMARGLAEHRDSARPHPPAAPEGLDLIVEVAHDIRSPLTSILFLAETLRRGQSGEVNALQHRQIGLIYSAALGMVSLTSDMIELAHGGERLVEERGSPFAVSEMLAAVCDLVHPIAEEKKVALRVLPLPTDHRIGSPAALSRVLLNLVTNALKYTDEGFVEITARARGASLVEFAVRDTGAGMDEETQSTLFDPFRPGRRSDRYGFSGTGLGLAICRRLVRALGSELHYESSPGWGTRFFFEVELPAAPL